MRRFLFVLGVLAVLAAVAGGGMVLGMAVEGEPEGMTEAEHDRLVDACVTQTDNGPGCTAWAGALVEAADRDGMSYVEVAEGMEDAFADESGTSDWNDVLRESCAEIAAEGRHNPGCDGVGPGARP